MSDGPIQRRCKCSRCGKAYRAPVQSRHRLICGDSTDAAVVDRLLDGRKPSLCFTSPPYNAGDNSLGGNSRRVDSKYVEGDDDLPPAEYLRLLVDFTRIALAHCRTVAVNLQPLANNKRTLLEWIHHYRDHLVDRMVWCKGAGCPAMPPNVMNARFEDIWILSPQVNPSRAVPTGRFQGTLSNVYEGPGASGQNVAPALHAASMPMHVALHMIESLDGTAGAVYEPFCGLGTTLIAAEQLGRPCLAVELVGRYVDVAVRRWQEFTGRAAVLERTGDCPLPIGGKE